MDHAKPLPKDSPMQCPQCGTIKKAIETCDGWFCACGRKLWIPPHKP